MNRGNQQKHGTALALASGMGLVLAVGVLGTAWAGRRIPRPPTTTTPTADAAAPTGPTCACPTPPENGFSLVLVRARQDITPQADFSESSTSAMPLRAGREVNYQLTSVATFYLPDDTRAVFSCSLKVGSDRAHLTDLGTCTLTLMKSGQTDAIGQATVPTIDIASLEDTRVQYSLPTLSINLSTGETVNMRGISFRASDSAAHFVTPPRALRP